MRELGHTPVSEANPFRPSCPLLGALLTVSTLVALVLLGIGVGVFGVRIADGRVGLEQMSAFVAVGAIVAILAAFFAGGFFAARASATTTRGRAAGNGFAVWAIASFFLVCVGGSALWGQLTKVQMSLGAAANAEAMLDALAQMSVRFVSDVKLLKGRAVTTLSMERPKNRILRKTAQELGQLGTLAAETVEQSPARLATVTEENHRTLAKAALMGFAALLLAAAASYLGASAGTTAVAAPRLRLARLKAAE